MLKHTGFYRWIAVILPLVVLVNLPGCKTTEKSITQAQGVEQESPSLENALLWKINGKDLDQPSYLFGTIHIIPGEDYFLPEGTLGAFDRAKKVVFEIDMGLMADISSQMALLKDIFMKDNLTLKDLLSDEEYVLVSDHFSKLGMPLFMLERMKPMFLSVFASTEIDIGGIQTGTMKSYEMEFFDMAESAKKPVTGLETIEYQLSMFDSIPYSAQAEMLVEAIRSSDTGSDQFRTMIDMYKAQNVNAMIKMISDDEGGMKGYEDLLVDQRNRNWIPVMAKMMKEHTTFFAVGAGHLAGENGVIRLLQKEGYQVKPVKGANDL